jgi:hypothetical protein
MSRFVHLPRRVLCPLGHRIPHPRIRPGDDGEPECVVGTCVPCGTFYGDLTHARAEFERWADGPDYPDPSAWSAPAERA